MTNISTLNGSAASLDGFNSRDKVWLYLAHTEMGISLRELARILGLYASTVLRRIRRIELLRDDPLMDEFIDRMASDFHNNPNPMKALISMTHSNEKINAREISETIRVLRRMCETGAFMAVTQGLENAVILREGARGKQTRSGVLDRAMAQNFVARDWISQTRSGKIMCYSVTDAGRAALRRMIAEHDGHLTPVVGFSEAPTAFGEQHREWGERSIKEGPNNKPVRKRVNLRESPLSTLGRKKDKNGKPYLSADLLDAGERMREDFELAQLGPSIAQNWDHFLTAGTRSGFKPGGGGGSSNAQERLSGALTALGPGLGDIVMRCCCFLEGMETAEKRMGWSARSGKIVLRIALQRLRVYYDDQVDAQDRMIG